MPGVDPHICIFHELNMRRIRVIGFVTDGLGCNPIIILSDAQGIERETPKKRLGRSQTNPHETSGGNKRAVL